MDEATRDTMSYDSLLASTSPTSPTVSLSADGGSVARALEKIKMYDAAGCSNAGGPAFFLCYYLGEK